MYLCGVCWSILSFWLSVIIVVVGGGDSIWKSCEISRKRSCRVAGRWATVTRGSRCPGRNRSCRLGRPFCQSSHVLRTRVKVRHIRKGIQVYDQIRENFKRVECLRYVDFFMDFERSDQYLDGTHKNTRMKNDCCLMHIGFVARYNKSFKHLRGFYLLTIQYAISIKLS